MQSRKNNNTKYYSSDFAVEIKNGIGQAGGNLVKTVEIITYLTGDPYSAEYIKKEILNNDVLVENKNYYLHRDNLGSILGITTSDGAITEKRMFDAWGNLKALTNDKGVTTTDTKELANSKLFLDRGYTGHEHLWTVGLINMNARLYDPILRKFLSPDSLVPDPLNTQSYDRYGYVNNNPLLLIDIDGNEPFTIGFGLALVIAAAVGITTHIIVNAVNGIPIWYGLGKATVISTVMGAVSFGIGSAASSAAVGFLGKAALQAGMHAMSGGIMSALETGNFTSGFLSGAVSSIISSGIQALGTNFNKTGAYQDSNHNYLSKNSFGSGDLIKAVMVVSGGLSGGLSATIAGGNFWQGFRQGVITSGLNHVSHFVVETFDRSNYDKFYAEVKKIMGSASAHFSGTPEDMWKMMQNVPTLRKLLNRLQGTKLYAVVLKNHPDRDKYEGRTDENGDGSLSIKIYMKGYSTNISVALTLGHELWHAWLIVNGSKAAWQSMIKPSADKVVANNYSVHQSEVAIYMSWNAVYADSQRTYDWAVGQSNYNMMEANKLLQKYGK